MKRCLLILPFVIILYGCPYESTVALEQRPVETVDTSLLGYWYGIVKDGSDYFGIEALDIKKQSDSVYSIIRYGKSVKGDMILPDTAWFTGYTSRIGDQRYMNVEGEVVIVEMKRKSKTPEVKKNKIYYIASFNISNDTIHVKTVTENFTPSRLGFKRPEDLKATITEMIGEGKNIYDDLYTLSYRRMNQ